MNNDYKAEFAAAVTDLIAEGIADRTERIAAVHALIDAYVDSVGKRPDGAQLERLTDYILREELTDTDSYKITHNEYPFMGDQQLQRRHNREAPSHAAHYEGTDGRNHRVPTRRRRNNYENWYVDYHAKIRNKERAAQYKKDTSPGEIKTYNLRDTDGELGDDFVACCGLGERWANELSLVYTDAK